MSTAAGKRRERVSFFRRTTAPDGMGNQLASWTPLSGPFWARIQPIRGGEQVIEQRLSGVNVYNIYVLSCGATRAITAEDRAVNSRTGEVYNITSTTNPDERNTEICLLVKSGSAES